MPNQIAFYPQASGGGSGAITLAVPTQTLAIAAASVTFSGIPATFKHLKSIMSTSNSNGGITQSTVFVRFNGDTGFNYSSAVVANAVLAQTNTANSIQVGSDFNNVGGQLPGAIEVTIPNYAQSGFQRQTLSISATYGGSNVSIQQCGGIWQSTTAISSITIFHGDGSSFAAGCTFSLYGLQ